jgi:carboxylate-amine ligase
MPASPPSTHPPTTASALRARFDAVAPSTVGIEEEVFLLDPETLDLAPHAEALLARLGGDPRFKRELPAAQLEIATAPAATAMDALAQLAAARRDLVAAAAGLVLPAAVGVHPFAAAEGALNVGDRYEAIVAEYGSIAHRQLVASLQVHVAVGGAERTLAVYGALRGLLPELAALSANAPFHDGRDSGLASVRPTICATLPRQGVPPALESWERVAEEWGWGAAAGSVSEPRRWWWELRPHPAFGTLELRVPDAQTTLADAGGVIAFAQALVGWLAERHDAGERLPAPATWRIEENRFSALRHGLDGTMADLATGELEPTRARLRRLLDDVAPVARRLGSAALLAHAAALVAEGGGAARQRAVAAERGVEGLAGWLAERFGAGAAAWAAPGTGKQEADAQDPRELARTEERTA